MFSAVVFTAGRTGSHLIANNLSSYFKSPLRSHNKIDYEFGVIHSHNPLYKPPNDNFVCIINKRRDEFTGMVSMLLTKRTGEFTKYSNKNIDSFNVSLHEFYAIYLYNKAFYKIIDQTNFKETIEICLEDMILDPYYLFNQFGIEQKTNYSLSPQSPYDLTKIITNLDELYQSYTELEKTPVTDKDIEQVRNSINTELHDIRVNHNGNRKDY
jgi:hypothetical protein